MYIYLLSRISDRNPSFTLVPTLMAGEEGPFQPAIHVLYPPKLHKIGTYKKCKARIPITSFRGSTRPLAEQGRFKDLVFELKIICA